MQAFLALYRQLDTTTSTLGKREAIANYFRTTPPTDAIWALYLLMGRKQKRLVSRRLLQDATLAMTDLPVWLFEECYAVVGDLAETIALLLPPATATAPSTPLRVWMEERLPAFAKADPVEQQEILLAWWRTHTREDIFLINKLMTGGFRAGVARQLMIKALADAFERDEASIAEGLTGDWTVQASILDELREPDTVSAPSQPLRPYPFYLATSIQEVAMDELDLKRYALEWKWDGIRAQLVRRGNKIALWSRGEELISDSFPEIITGAQDWPVDAVLDGELLLRRDGQILPFAELQKRITRKKLSASMLNSHPAIFLAFDCLELDGVDLRGSPQYIRRQQLERFLADASPLFPVSPVLHAETWDEARKFWEEAALQGGEGLMLKSWDGPYKQGRRRGDWWKWKVDPMTLDSVLVYAQAGHGRRATLFTDYTFALWKDGALVPFAKAYSGLTDSEIQELDAWIRRHTLERFGPVRSVTPTRVFEIAFEGIGPSSRHKSGLAVRFPRILRERTDKRPEDADTVDRARELINGRTQNLVRI